MSVPLAVNNEVSVLIDKPVLPSLHQRVQQENAKHEIGGLLLGFRFSDAIRVVKPTFPGPGDISKYSSFSRCCPTHQLAASSWWAQSQRKGDWVGEWHSHPENRPQPSAIDIRTWKRLVSHTGRPMVFIIIGLQTYFAAILYSDRDNLIELPRP